MAASPDPRAEPALRYRVEFDRLQAEQAAVDQTIQFLIKLKANLQLDADRALDKLAQASTTKTWTVKAKR